MGRIKDKFIWFLARHMDNVPYMLSTLVSERFDVEKLVKATDDPFPGRVWFRRISRPEVRREDGTFRYGYAPLTVGQRFGALQAIKRGDMVKALEVYFRLRKWEILAGKFWKINALGCHMAKDLAAREKRDAKLQTPLTDMQRRAGYADIKTGLFGVIDYIAIRNGLKYGEVEELSDLTMYAILKLDHDKAMVQRREMELRMSEAKKKTKARR